MTKKYDRRLNVGSEHEFGSSDSEDESDDDFDEFNGSEEEDFFQCQNISDNLNASKQSSCEVASLSNETSPFSTAVRRAVISDQFGLTWID